jgi:hypothetical protein
MAKGRKPDRDPVSWTRDRHPWSASKEEVGILINRGLSFVNERIKDGDFKIVRRGRPLEIITDSVFDYQDRVLAESKDQLPPKGGPGRPKKRESDDPAV